MDSTDSQLSEASDGIEVSLRPPVPDIQEKSHPPLVSHWDCLLGCDGFCPCKNAGMNRPMTRNRVLQRVPAFRQNKRTDEPPATFVRKGS